MYPKTKSTFFSRHTLSIILAFGLVALIVGVYFLFKPFPAGPSLDVKASVREAASAAGWSAYANAPVSVNSAASMPGSVGEFALSQQRNFGASSVSSAASVPSSVQEFALSQQRNFGPSSVSSAASMPSSVLEFASAEQRNFAPNSDLTMVDTASSAAYLQRFGINAGYMSDSSAQDGISGVPDSSLLSDDAASVTAYLQRFGINAGSVPNSDRAVVDTASTAAYLQRFSINAGYMSNSSSLGGISGVPDSSLPSDDVASVAAYLHRFGINAVTETSSQGGSMSALNVPNSMSPSVEAAYVQRNDLRLYYAMATNAHYVPESLAKDAKTTIPSDSSLAAAIAQRFSTDAVISAIQKP